jgi:PAX-interacting protein 1
LAVGELGAIISCNDKLAVSGPGNGSRAAVGEDLAAYTRARLQSKVWTTPESNSSVKKKSRRLDSVALSLVSSDGSVANSLNREGNFDMMERRYTIASNLNCPRVKVSGWTELLMYC